MRFEVGNIMNADVDVGMVLGTNCSQGSGKISACGMYFKEKSTARRNFSF